MKRENKIQYTIITCSTNDNFSHKIIIMRKVVLSIAIYTKREKEKEKNKQKHNGSKNEVSGLKSKSY